MKDDTTRATFDADEQPGVERDDFTGARPRQEPVFTGFDEEEDYEEPERDTDYASRYVDEDLDDELEEIGDFEDSDELEPDWHEEEDQPGEEEDEAVADSEPDWDGEEYDDEYDEPSKWPLGLVAVGLMAVVLLAAGGYGVLQQRAATAEEIRQLRAQLATASKPVEVPVDNQALAEARKRNIELSTAMESLKLENRRLLDTVAGLETQLEAQQEALAKPAPPPPTPAPKPPPAKPRSQPAASASAGSGAAGSWFVNFGSYSQRGTADSWAARLKPGDGRAVVTTGSRDGKTFYRVRVIELPDKAAADRVARQLESEYGLTSLWVGK